MRRLVPFVLLFMLLIVPLVKACMTPADAYAVEVVLNKPGIESELRRLEIAHNVLKEDSTFIFRSHYDEGLYVMVWNASDGLHVRVQIPVEWREVNVSLASFNTSLVITKDALEKLKAEGWKITGEDTFKREGITIRVSSVPGKQCTSDSDCATGGCSGEVCAPKEEAGKIVTPCVYKPWYDCLSLTSCGCVNGLCSWKPNPTFESCLREHGVEPSSVIRTGNARVEVMAIDKSPGEITAAVKDFLGAFGVSCDPGLSFVENRVRELSPAVEPSKVNASEALKAELEWLREFGIVKVGEDDVDAILRVAQWGRAGINSKIGWYETKNGSYAWIPYSRSKNPQLVKCFSRQVPENELPNGTAYIGSTPTTPPSSTGTGGSPEPGGVCGPGLVVGLALVSLLLRRG